MYESFYRLNANPFRLVPDARLFYASSGHKRGLAYLRYGLHQGQGFVVVTGKPGTGKSTLVQTLFTDLTDESMVVAGLTSTNLGADDILQAVGHSFDVYGDGKSKASLLIGIEKFLKARARQGKRVVLIVDEAQNLPLKSLEELRMLSNFQLAEQPLLQILLLGQQELQEMLARPALEQLAQRVIASCHLKPLSAEETRAYIAHRLRCVGWRGDPSIAGEALALIYSVSHGIPRLINIFCDRLLLAASLEERHDIDQALAQAVLTELREESTGSFALCSASPTHDLPLPASLTEADLPLEAANDAEADAEPQAAQQAVAPVAGGETAAQGPKSDTAAHVFEPVFDKAKQGHEAFQPSQDAQDHAAQPDGAEQKQRAGRGKKWGLLLLLLVAAAGAAWFGVKKGADLLPEFVKLWPAAPTTVIGTAERVPPVRPATPLENKADGSGNEEGENESDGLSSPATGAPQQER